MCTLILLRRPQHHWPLLLAGNRDEMPDRPWASPARHWSDRPGTVAGLDRLAGGSWMGLNDQGVVCVVMNRVGTLGPDPQKRSRGELVLEVLEHAEAKAAARALSDLEPRSYRRFNLLIGDPRHCFWLRHDGLNIETTPVPPGLHMLTSMELDDEADPRIRRYLPLFRAAATPDPDREQWGGWPGLLSSSRYTPGEARSAAMCFRLDTGLCTLSSSLIAIPGPSRAGVPPVWMHTPGPPDRTGFLPVDLSPRK